MGEVLTPQNRAATEAVPGIPFPKHRENRQYWDYESYCQGPKGLTVGLTEPSQKKQSTNLNITVYFKSEWFRYFILLFSTSSPSYMLQHLNQYELLPTSCPLKINDSKLNKRKKGSTQHPNIDFCANSGKTDNLFFTPSQPCRFYPTTVSNYFSVLSTTQGYLRMTQTKEVLERERERQKKKNPCTPVYVPKSHTGH